MFSGRSCHSHGCHSRGSRSHGRDYGRRGCGLRGAFDEYEGLGKHCSFELHCGSGGRDREQIDWGREDRCRMPETPVLHRRPGSLGGLGDGMGGLGLGGLGGFGGLGGLGGFGAPGLGRRMMPRGSLGLGRGPSLYDGRGSFSDGGLLGLGQSPFGRRGHGLDLPGPRENLLLQGPRLSLLGGGLSPPRSPLGSLASGNDFDLMALDRPRMPYGPLGPRMSNYRPPYVEDYYSDIDPEEQRALEEMYGMGGGNPFLYNNYAYGNELAGQGGPF
jgi:hypothetical protein